MPLPEAKDPKTSNLYSQLRSSQLRSIAQASFDKVKGPVFINSDFEDEARRLKLWGELAGTVSSSGPMIGTLKCVVTDSITSTSKTSIYTPSTGEIWQVIGLSVTATNATGSTTWYSYMVEGAVDVYMGATSSASSNVSIWTDSDYKNPVFISAETQLEININATSNLDSYVIKTALVRVR